MKTFPAYRLLLAAALSYFFLPANVAAASDFPLTEGNWWQLKSKTWQGATIDIRLSGVRPGLAGTSEGEMEFISPWGNLSFLIRSSAAGVFHEGFRINGEESRFPAPAAMFPKGKRGDSWTTILGTVTLADTGLTVKAGTENITGVSLYRLRYWDGSEHTWMISPVAGIVQFGEGDAAFTLASRKAVAAGDVPATVPANCPLLGIDWNPLAANGFSKESKDAVAADIKPWNRYVDIAATWRELEPSPNVYQLSNVTAELARAAKNGATVSFTLKPLDGPNRQLPADLANRSWDDPALISRWQKLLAKLTTSLRGKVSWLHVANEVDSYFLINPGELDAFEKFLVATRSQLAGNWPEVSTGLVHAYDTARTNNSVFLRLKWFSQHYGFTYYALDGLSPREKHLVPGDLIQLQLLAGDRPIVLTELGHPSALGDQPGFYEETIATLRRAGGRVKAARFFQLNELPGDVVNQLAAAYGFDTSSPAIQFFRSLGVHDGSGQPKPAWGIYRDGASSFQNLGACWAN